MILREALELALELSELMNEKTKMIDNNVIHPNKNVPLFFKNLIFINLLLTSYYKETTFKIEFAV